VPDAIVMNINAVSLRGLSAVDHFSSVSSSALVRLCVGALARYYIKISEFHNLFAKEPTNQRTNELLVYFLL